MPFFVFYTDEGYTIAPNNAELENLQILGIEYGETKEDALDNLYKNNDWIITNGFSESRICSYTIFESENA